jgi:hypothetical protein
VKVIEKGRQGGNHGVDKNHPPHATRHEAHFKKIPEKKAKEEGGAHNKPP